MLYNQESVFTSVLMRVTDIWVQTISAQPVCEWMYLKLYVSHSASC